MEIVGIVAEYNPFHNGHLYHLECIKKMFPDAIIIVVLSGQFMQRGEASIINKWDKTDIALTYGADIVIELPFPFATQSADIFAKGSIEILKSLGVKKLVFGSESNDIEKLKDLALIQLNNNEYQSLIKKYLDEGINYPTALSKSLASITNKTVDTPNDILGISYIREIMRQEALMEPIAIKRTNDYHSTFANDKVASATSIRASLRTNDKVQDLVPNKTYEYLNKHLFFIEDYFSYLKYQIMINIDSLNKFQTVDEGIENRIKKNIIESHNLDELISKIKTKRYTYNKIRRMLTHIMCNFTKEEAEKFKNITYLRILGFSDKGQKYLNQIKKNVRLPILSKFNKANDPMLDLEMRVTSVYASILNEEEKMKLIQAEYKNNPIRKTVL
jgi:predicted nucleotidyltransferase